MNGYNILVKGDTKILVDDTRETKDKGVTATLNFLIKTAYNEIILAQEDTVCFQIIEEERKQSSNYKGSSQTLVKLLIRFDPTTGYSKGKTMK